MTATNLYHALGLHMHQPPGNLRSLIECSPDEAESIMRCYERAVRHSERYRDVAKLHVGFSGVLLEQLLDPDIVDRYRHVVDIPLMLQRYRDAENIELVGTGYYHPIFPLISRLDWPEQLERGRAIMERVFGRAPRGFWPPELAFSVEMIPDLVRAGYEYVVVDGVHARPEDGLSDIFRPYKVCYDGVCISVVPRDRDVSQAQGSGLDLVWFQDAVTRRVAGSPRPEARRLVTSWSDGENGGWFRQLQESSGFFGDFFTPYMEARRSGSCPIEPVCLTQYLAEMRSLSCASFQTSAWGAVEGEDLARWAGNPGQSEALAEVRRLAARYWEFCRARPNGYEVAAEAMVRARRLILEAETSCFLFWGDAWLPHLYARTQPAEQALDEVERSLLGQSGMDDV